MHIIIPINGKGRRFQEAGYSLPKPLIPVLGEEMIIRVLKSFRLEATDRVTILYNKDLDAYNFSNLLKHKFKHPVRLCALHYETRGAAETVLCGINSFSKAERKEPILIADGDTIYEEDILGIYRKKAGNHLFCFEDNQDYPIYSYVRTDGELVVDIKEKEKISNLANTGAYGFSSGSLFQKYCEQVIDNNEQSKKEFFISNIYKRMLESGEKVTFSEIRSFHCVGTPFQLEMFAFGELSKREQKRFCFDIDNTLLTTPEIPGDYSTVKPIERNVRFLKFLKNNGQYIILYTARRMKTHQGNTGKIVADVGAVTLQTLADFDIPYDEIYFGKPYADFYVDDLAVNPQLDLHKATGFFDGKLESRSFNHIQETETSIVKKGRIEGEKFYYQNIPESISRLFPKLLSQEMDKIEIEKIRGICLSKLYANNCLTRNILKKTIDALTEIHAAQPVGKTNIYLNYKTKLLERLPTVDALKKYSVDCAEFNEILDSLSSYEKGELGECRMIHGDPVFTNIILDSENNIRFIDMRGKCGEIFTTAGDMFYDYAKLYQSLLGYDHIINNCRLEEGYIGSMKAFFEEMFVEKFGEDKLEQLRYLTKSLVLSLLPLHEKNLGALRALLDRIDGKPLRIEVKGPKLSVK